MVVTDNLFITDLTTLPCTGFRCPPEDSSTVTYNFQIVDKPGRSVFFVWMPEQIVFKGFKVATINVLNHISSPYFLKLVVSGLIIGFAYSRYLPHIQTVTGFIN